MSRSSYRLTVIGCMLSWLFVGLHFPVFHHIMGHGQAPRWSVLSLTLLFIVLGIGTLWMLLRETPSPGNSSDVGGFGG